MIQDEGVTRFIDSHLWTKFYDEVGFIFHHHLAAFTTLHLSYDWENVFSS